MTATDTSADVNARLDHLSAQVDLIAEELRLQRESREKWSDLVETLQPVTSGAMDMATVQFQELSEDVTIDDATEFLKTLARSLPQLNALMAQLDSLSQLAELVSSLSGPALAKVTDFLEVADEKGYFAFARQSGEIADRVVTEFDEDDVRALGENVVTILNAVKELTQPEIMAMLQRTAVTIQEGEDTPSKPPSLFALIKSMREPQTRRGLGRVLNMLNTVGEQSVPAQVQTTAITTQPTNSAAPK